MVWVAEPFECRKWEIPTNRGTFTLLTNQVAESKSLGLNCIVNRLRRLVRTNDVSVSKVGSHHERSSSHIVSQIGGTSATHQQLHAVYVVIVRCCMNRRPGGEREGGGGGGGV